MNSGIDAGLYSWITGLAQRVPRPVDTLIQAWSDYGLVVFAVLMLVAWWRARQGDAARMATALSVPVAVVVAYAVNDVLKMVFDEQRPCQTLRAVTIEACPAPGDWSFPSNHAAIAAAAAVALLVIDRGLGYLAVPAALFMAASRVWIGVHYPHDVLIGVIVGALVARPLVLHAHRAAPAVERLRGTKLKPLLIAA